MLAALRTFELRRNLSQSCTAISTYFRQDSFNIQTCFCSETNSNIQTNCCSHMNLNLQNTVVFYKQLQNYHNVTCLSLISIGNSSAGARIKLKSIPIHDKMIHLLLGLLLSFSCGLWLVACGLWFRVYNVVE